MQEVFNEPCETYYKIFTDVETGGYPYRFLSPFEFKDTLVERAAIAKGDKDLVIDAGRGNPNFFSTIPRYAFAHLLNIATMLGESSNQSIGFFPTIEGIETEFDDLMNNITGTSSGKFLKMACKNMFLLSKDMSRAEFLHSLVMGALGCYYPSPPRVQPFVEPVLREFFKKVIYRQRSIKGITKDNMKKMRIMPTEGAAAAILYVFNTLKYNGLVIPGDKVGIFTPIFSPYLELPNLANYKLETVCIKADPDSDWEIPDSELEKIADPKMKALFLVNPTNPTSYGLSKKTINKVATIVRTKNPTLIILEDNVYAPFVREFNDFFVVLPMNTIGIFSFSKYFGVTGWRLGSIQMNKRNIIDKVLLKSAPSDVHGRYSMLQTNPSKIKFIDRVLADSRQVAEAHVAGLSTPQQTIMALFAMSELMDKQQEYSMNIRSILNTRMTNLLAPLNYMIPESSLSANYYVVLDICKIADKIVANNDFTNYLRKHKDPLEFLLNLADKYGVVLLPAIGFAGPFWSVRVSLANLTDEKYMIIGESLRDLIDVYYQDFLLYNKPGKK